MKVAVIGAGATGLCCARHLSRFPDLFNFSVFEQSKQIGGTWVYSDRIGTDEHGLPVHSSMYENLRYSGIPPPVHVVCVGYHVHAVSECCR